MERKKGNPMTLISIKANVAFSLNDAMIMYESK